MISSRLRRRGPLRCTPQIVPVIQEKLDWTARRESILGSSSKEAILQEWRERWQAARGRSRWCSIAATVEPGKERLKLHKELKKAESAILIQARTGRIGLAHFLNKARVPGFESPDCRCTRGIETTEHLLLHCPLEVERRKWTRGSVLHDLVSELQNTATTARWLIQSGRIRQFQLASEILYNRETSIVDQA